jgi:hypothetical protein
MILIDVGCISSDCTRRLPAGRQGNIDGESQAGVMQSERCSSIITFIKERRHSRGEILLRTLPQVSRQMLGGSSVTI